MHSCQAAVCLGQSQCLSSGGAGRRFLPGSNMQVISGDLAAALLQGLPSGGTCRCGRQPTLLLGHSPHAGLLPGVSQPAFLWGSGET